MWLFLAFVAVPLIEIALFIQVGGLIGLWPTLLIVVVTAILGTWLVRSQGALAMNNLRRSFDRLEDPSEPLAHGAMILLAGALLLTPGFFTDAVGFALLTPGFRTMAFNFLKKRIKVQRFEMGGQAPGGAGPHPQGPHPQGPHPRGPGARGPQGPGPRRPEQGEVIEGEYQEIDTSKQPTHRPSGWTKH